MFVGFSTRDRLLARLGLIEVHTKLAVEPKQSVQRTLTLERQLDVDVVTGRIRVGADLMRLLY